MEHLGQFYVGITPMPGSVSGQRQHEGLFNYVAILDCCSKFIAQSFDQPARMFEIEAGLLCQLQASLII